MRTGNGNYEGGNTVSATEKNSSHNNGPTVNYTGKSCVTENPFGIQQGTGKTVEQTENQPGGKYADEKCDLPDLLS